MLFASVVFFQELEEKFEYLFLESGEHGILYDEYHLGSIIDDGNLVTVDHLAHIVVEEVKMLGNRHDLAFQSWTLGFGKCLARDNTSLYLFHSD